ncbi:MBL fold metallo-hydrolase [Haliscomenobacter sp.]|uniref:MBL fold metallo-hydrolase n=1 Tax=Haliscomenobacter sp. TaxID=2717303 RepID=UPI003364CE94
MRQIFISHLHEDHIFGLAGLLAAYPARKHSYKVEIFSPRLTRQKRVKLWKYKLHHLTRRP